jgi:hypothetical protein
VDFEKDVLFTLENLQRKQFTGMIELRFDQGEVKLIRLGKKDLDIKAGNPDLARARHGAEMSKIGQG